MEAIYETVMGFIISYILYMQHIVWFIIALKNNKFSVWFYFVELAII